MIRAEDQHAVAHVRQSVLARQVGANVVSLDRVARGSALLDDDAMQQIYGGPLPDNQYVLSLQAGDVAGNVGSPQTLTMLLTRTAPSAVVSPSSMKPASAQPPASAAPMISVPTSTVTLITVNIPPPLSSEVAALLLRFWAMAVGYARNADFASSRMRGRTTGIRR